MPPTQVDSESLGLQVSKALQVMRVSLALRDRQATLAQRDLRGKTVLTELLARPESLFSGKMEGLDVIASFLDLRVREGESDQRDLQVKGSSSSPGTSSRRSRSPLSSVDREVPLELAVEGEA